MWNCNACTFMNSAKCNSCVVCNANRNDFNSLQSENLTSTKKTRDYTSSFGKLENKSIDDSLKTCEKTKENTCNINYSLSLVEETGTRGNLADDQDQSSIDSRNSDVPRVPISRNDGDKWICKACTFINSFNYDNCASCYSKLDESCLWNCERCTYNNKISDYKCAVCESENKSFADSIKNSIKICKEKPHSKDSIDKKEKSGVKNLKRDQKSSYNKKFVSNASKSSTDLRIDNENEQQIYRDNYVKKTKTDIWVCGNRNCNVENTLSSNLCKGCKVKRFPMCVGKDEENQKSDLNERENKEKSGDTKQNSSNVAKNSGNQVDKNKEKKKDQNNQGNKSAGDWKCWNQNCKQDNNLSAVFCQTCKLNKEGTYENAILNSKAGQKPVWICKTCHKFISVGLNKCNGKECTRKK